MHASVEISLILWCSVSFLVSEGTAPVFPQPPGAIEAGRKAALARHNVFRCMHGAPPLVLDDTINRVAQDYAEKLATEDKFEHSQNGHYGENIYTWFLAFLGGKAGHSEINVTAQMIDATNAWYTEEQFYKPWPGQTKVFADPDPKHQTGHFTALVWKETQKVGLGIGISISQIPASQNNKVFTRTTVVANYAPGGNMYAPVGDVYEAKYYDKNVEPCPSKTEAECGGVAFDYQRVEKKKFCDKLNGKGGGGVATVGSPNERNAGGGGGSSNRRGTERGNGTEAGGAEAVALSTFLGLLSLLMSLNAVF